MSEERRDLADKREFSKAWRQTRMVSTLVLTNAKTKPRGVSDIRWRMELRRRQNPDYYATAGDLC